MKRYITILASLLVLAGCSDRLNVAENMLTDGEMTVNLRVDAPMAGPGTRSYVNGTETAVSTITMLCFDIQGAYITSRNGTVTATDATHGTLTGQVPANTCRVHFVANFEGLDLSGVGMGSLERTVMKSPQLASGVNDAVRFWGYHKESSAGAMAAWLNSANTLVLLRDRAKVTVINQDSDIRSLQWTISNGLNKGFVAAASAADNANPYDNNYTSGTILTEYRSSGVYTLTEETAAWTAAGAANPQFLFENSNSTVPVKIIVKATFTDNSVRYHTILLQDADKKLYRIFRNQSFVLTIKDLPSAATTTSIGADNFDDAASTENYSNNPFAQVAREVNEVNDETYKLTVEDVTKIFDNGTTGSVRFTFTKHDGTATSFSNTDFEASWEPKSDDDERPDVSPVTTTPTVAYNASTGEGTVTFSLNQITSDLKFNTLQLVSPSGLTRYVDIYSISQFAYKTAPALVDNGTKRTVGDYQRETYKLTFQLPEVIPAMFPLTVKMYSDLLVPFSDNTATAPHGSFNVAVGKTTSLDATDQSAQWNYNANKWDYWYEFVINEPSADGNYTVYLNSFVEEQFPERLISTVGLYFEIEHFGARKALSEVAPQPRTVTSSFTPSDFSFSNHSASKKKDNINVTFNDSDKEGNYIEAGYNSWFFGTIYHNGSVTITPDTGYNISNIEITYRSGYTGGNVSASRGSFSKNGTTGTWSGELSDESVTLTFQRTNNNAYAQIESIKVTTKSF